MTRLLLILALLAVCFWVYSVVDCAVQPATRHRGVSKPAWIVLVLVIPVLGGVLWFSIGRMRRAQVVAARQAPDDDPAFLRTLADLPDTDARIRRLEEELANLDAEADPDAPPASPAGPEPKGPAADGDDDSRGTRGARS